MSNVISFFTAYLDGTHGTAKSARDFLRALLACQDEIRVIAPRRECFPADLCGAKLGVPTWLDMPRGVGLPRSLQAIRPRRIWEWISDRAAMRQLRRRCSGDVVIVNGWASYGRWRLVAGLFSGMTVVVIRESPRHFAGPDRILMPPDLLAGFSRFDFLIFVSQRVSGEWRRDPVLAAKPYAILPNCCEEEEASRYSPADRESVRRGLGLRPDEFVLLCPGSIEHRKGQDLLLEVVPQLLAGIPGLRILLVGDPATSWGRDLVGSLTNPAFGGSITYWPARPGIMDLMFAADLLVFPSRAEALPRTILEAMVMQTPIVTSDADGIPELIEDGTSGLLFAVDDAQGLLQAILRLYEAPELRCAMSRSAALRYWTHFSRRRQFERMKDLVARLGGAT